jgi:predicted phage baseplate assembly protein
MLTNSGTVNVQDALNNTYLEVQAVNPTAWPPRFGLLAQGDIANPDQFNLLVLYSPASGGVGVSLPVTVEEFDNVTLQTVASNFTSSAQLISVRSFGQEPSLSVSAYDLMNYDANQAIPSITLYGAYNSTNTVWNPLPDLLGDGPTDTNFVVEVEYTGAAFLRFGDDTNGMRPDSGTTFTATYRIGNGTAGNVGANSLQLFVGDPRIISCTNPLPAMGGVDMETNAQIRRRAPAAFLTQERAVTMADYETVTEMNTQVENAVATLRWTGSWYTVFITAEPVSAGSLSKSLQRALLQNISRYRLAGQDLQLESPQYVPLQIALTVCVDPAYFQSHVLEGLQQVLGSGLLPSGEKALFYPSNFTFGQTVYLSPIYAAARTVPGVVTVTATTFAPQGVTTNLYLSQGEIPLGPFQIARMDNDPSFPNHGQLTLTLQGGK